MFLSTIIAILCGILAGVVTGLIPGIHINLVSLLLVSISGYFLAITSSLTLGVFIIAMAVTHTFLDSIPSIFLGAPDADMVLGVLPGHKLLLEGKGYEAVKLTTIGSLVCLVLVVLIIPIMIPAVPWIYSVIQPFIGWILIFVVVFMLLKENGVKGKLWGSYVFLLSGVLGMIVFSLPNLKQPLFPMLSGLFGVSTLITSLSNNVKVPKQKITETIVVEKKNKFKAYGAAVFSGSLTGMFPGLGSAQAAILSTQLVGDIGNHAFLILVGGINTVNFVFSLVTLYTLQKARNGAIVAVMEILKEISVNELVVFLCAALIAGGIATFLALFITRGFSSLINKINYRKLCISIITLISVLVLYFSGIIGILILVVSTAIGIIPALVGVKRSNAMGCLLLPVILYFIL
ncbi:tripartite tricarboxylate transporter permease [Candidatus Woesearchaeota archaeon]|nr:tripartite tricarboxylate transporter permease [Candidatus Woesearchaeota archaeon]